MMYYPTAYTSEETDGIYATNSGITDGDSLIQQAYYGKDIDLKAYGDLDKTRVEYDPNYNPNAGSNGDLYIDIYNEGCGLYSYCGTWGSLYPWYSGYSTWDYLYPWYSGYSTWDYLYPWYYPRYRYWGVGGLYYTGGWIRDRDIPRRTYLKNPRYDKLGETDPHRYNTSRSNIRKVPGKNPRYYHRKYTRTPSQRNNASRNYHRNAVPHSNPSTVGSHKSRGRSAPLRYHRR
ncbi:MAG: hypothetical protein V6Z82_03800 [Flavobacteriales bacterium]